MAHVARSGVAHRSGGLLHFGGSAGGGLPGCRWLGRSWVGLGRFGKGGCAVGGPWPGAAPFETTDVVVSCLEGAPLAQPAPPFFLPGLGPVPKQESGRPMPAEACRFPPAMVGSALSSGLVLSVPPAHRLGYSTVVHCLFRCAPPCSVGCSSVCLAPSLVFWRRLHCSASWCHLLVLGRASVRASPPCEASCLFLPQFLRWDFSAGEGAIVRTRSGCRGRRAGLLELGGGGGRLSFFRPAITCIVLPSASTLRLSETPPDSILISRALRSLRSPSAPRWTTCVATASGLPPAWRSCCRSTTTAWLR